MYYNLKAIILKREDFKDDDLLITCYSQQKGKLVLQAKGAKKIKSKLAGHLEPMCLSNLNVTIGKSIDQLIGAQIIQSYQKIKDDLQKLAYANYFIELVNELTKENHADKHIFSLLYKSLDYLEEKEIYPNPAQAGEACLREAEASLRQRQGSREQQTVSGSFVPASSAGPQDKLHIYIIARISFGFKLLYLLGFNPVGKAEVKLKNEIEFIIKNSLDKIKDNQDILDNLVLLNQILNQEIEMHLGKELSSKEFLKQIVLNGG